MKTERSPVEATATQLLQNLTRQKNQDRTKIFFWCESLNGRQQASYTQQKTNLTKAAA